MIRSLIFSDGKLVGQDLEREALRLVRSDKGLLLWVDLDHPTEDETKFVLDTVFQFHPLAIEDCVAPSSLPKVEDYEVYLFIVTHAVDFTRTEKFNTTELDVFLGRDFIVTFHRVPLRPVSLYLERMSKSVGTGPRGPDRIAHTLIDTLIDNYAPVIEELRDELEDIEEQVLSTDSRDRNLVNEILHVRSDFTQLRTIIRPQRDVIDRLARGDSKLIRAKLLPYYRDLRDNLTRFEATAATYQDRMLMAFDIYLNKAAFEASEGIKFLTAITAVTIPVMVFGTWFGMNFTGMPELARGYPWVVGLTIVTTLLMVLYLKRKKWF
jgi:magnesium transporter